MACRLICMTRATAVAAKPRATSSRDRATRSLTPSLSLQCFLRDLELVGLPAQLPLAAALLLPGQRLATTLEELVAPGVEERVRDLVLTADLFHRAIATQ